MENPTTRSEYLLHWLNKTDIGNVDMAITKENDKDFIVVSYKSIGINTYNVFVIDLKT